MNFFFFPCSPKPQGLHLQNGNDAYTYFMGLFQELSDRTHTEHLSQRNAEQGSAWPKGLPSPLCGIINFGLPPIVSIPLFHHFMLNTLASGMS